MTEYTNRQAYQEALHEQFKQATASPSATALGLVAGEDRWLVTMDEVGEVLPLSALTPIALTKPWFLGVTNVRGDLYGIIDLAMFFGGAVTQHGTQTRLLLVSPKYGVNTGLLVSDILGIRSLNDFEFVEEMDVTSQMVCIGCYVDKDEQRWNKLNIRALIHDKQFLQIAV